MKTPTAYYATSDRPADAYYSFRREVLTRHDTRADAYAYARSVAANRPGTKAGVVAAHHVEV